MKIAAIGLDLAKNVFQVHGVDPRGVPVLRKQLKRIQVLPFFATLEPCLVGMEACCGAHFWARKLQAYGHTVKLIAPQFVKPYVKSNKNDAADAEAICEAVSRPNMRFVPVKSIEQQAILALHRVRQGFVTARTAHANQIRSLLAEYGLVVPQGIHHLHQDVPDLLEDVSNELPGVFRQLVMHQLDYLRELDRQVQLLEAQIKTWHRENEASRRLAQIPGIGPITATALVASVGDARCFASGRQLAAWIGLVPRQHSSGGKQVLLGIGKRGDAYLRCLLVHGARAVISAVRQKADTSTSWLGRLLARRHTNIATVALANRNARIAWALLAHHREFCSDYGRAAPVV
ncbi:IS110 family transposase [Paraburkholderia sp. RP-4-7]|uniref:IS110 family transposase n=1 Tax=Paraburkholderia polaris TaxID=2728848 RepID=A0A848I909_9BURK|nr:IS110 family transposase [Paraburkholderia polaris]NML96604.1 IS110 family transposase [Paraburkholderia polaris]